MHPSSVDHSRLDRANGGSLSTRNSRLSTALLRLRTILAFSAVVAALFVVGCATGGYTYVKTISTGERLHFPLVKGRPEMAKSGNIEIVQAALMPSPVREKKEVVYLFAFSDKSPEPAKSVIVEDVSDDSAKLMVEDLHPKFNKGRWVGYSRVFTPNDAALNWLTFLDDSIRVFRFTITSASGEKIVLHQAWMVPAGMKMAMRAMLGMK
jgi:hypothetical protein